MALQPLPAPARVDYSRRGRLTIAREVLCGILNFPPGHAVTRFELDGDGDLVVEIAGADGKVELAWAHDPEKRWRLR